MEVTIGMYLYFFFWQDLIHLINLHPESEHSHRNVFMLKWMFSPEVLVGCVECDCNDVTHFFFTVLHYSDFRQQKDINLFLCR